MSRGSNQVPILIKRQGRPRARAAVINVRESPPSGRMASLSLTRRPRPGETQIHPQPEEKREGSRTCVVMTRISVFVSKGLSSAEKQS